MAVVVGRGAVTPLGHTLATSMDRLLAGEGAIGPITRFDASSFPVNIGAEGPRVHRADGSVEDEAVALCRAWLGAALDQGLDGVDLDPVPPARRGVFLGAEAATSADGDETLRRLLRAAQDFDPRAAIDGVAAEVERLGPLGAAYFAAVYVVAEVLALPAVPLTASAGYLFGAVEGTAIVLFSATIAAGVSFLIGRSLLRSWVERVAGESAQFQAIDRAVASEGFKIILLLRLSPIFPFALSNYFYGLTAVEFGPYLAATLLGFAPGTFLYVYSGEVASVAAGAAGDDAAYPWYVYAGFLSVGAFVAAKVTEVATRALEESGGIVADGDD